jgi:hypothetical protein
MSNGIYAFRPDGERFLFDSNIHEALIRPRIPLAELAIGSMLSVVLAEGTELTHHAELLLKLMSHSQNQEDGLTKLGVIKAEVNPEIVRLNRKSGIPKPELMGGIIKIRYSCVYTPDNMPPMTMVSNDAIVTGQHLFLGIPVPTDALPHRAFEYHAEVLYAEAFPA